VVDYIIEETEAGLLEPSETTAAVR
jgi:hypothetical protein